MIYITAIWSLPLVMLAWALSAWLFLASVRLVLGQLRATRYGKLCHALAELTDPPVHAVARRMCRWRPVPTWVPWLFTVLAVIVLRHLLIQLIVQAN